MVFCRIISELLNLCVFTNTCEPYVRTVVRTDGSDVKTNPKFLAFTGYQNLLAMGLRALAFGARSSAINTENKADALNVTQIKRLNDEHRTF